MAHSRPDGWATWGPPDLCVYCYLLGHGKLFITATARRRAPAGPASARTTSILGGKEGSYPGDKAEQGGETQRGRPGTQGQEHPQNQDWPQQCDLVVFRKSCVTMDSSLNHSEMHYETKLSRCRVTFSSTANQSQGSDISASLTFLTILSTMTLQGPD